jgi:RHS repeat-associated protein
VGANTILGYDATDNLVATYDPNKRPTQSTYDALDQLIQTTDALGGTATLTYDAVGNITNSTDELGRVTTYTYDNRNRLKTVTDPLNRMTTYGYDAVGNLVSVTDPLNHTTTYSYDALNRQVGIMNALGNTTLTAYDANGNITAIADPAGNVTTYAYDALNRQIAETNVLGYSRSYGYDANSNLVRTTDRDGRVRTFAYDALNRRTTEKWLDASGQSLNTFSYSYDANSQLKMAEDANSTYSYRYDAGGRLTSVDNTGTPGMPSVLLNYSYDPAGNRIKTTDTIKGSLKGITAYVYDALNRLTRITQSGSGVLNKRVDMTYDAASQLTGINRYSDLTGTQLAASSAYTYDAAGQLIDLQHRNTTSVLADYGYSYDADGRLIATTSSDGSSAYSYDEIDQLTGATHSYQTNEDYSYDENGNRTNAGYQTGANNQLLSDGVYNYSYDKEGNRTKRTNIATGEVTDYIWDYRNRLTQVTVKNAAGTVIEQVQYSYDLYDRRIAQTVDPDGAGATLSTTERYVYDGDNLALVFDGQGNLKERYLFGTQVDQVLAEEKQGNVLWMLADSQGTVRDMVDNTGLVLNHLSYDSFGNITNETKPAIEVRFTYAGREFDASTGLYYYRSRYFDPLTGGFISEDTIGFVGGDANLYRYVFNSPLNATDPFGLASQEILSELQRQVDLCNSEFPEGFSTKAEEKITIKLKNRIIDLGGELPPKRTFTRDARHGASFKDELKEAIDQLEKRRKTYEDFKKRKNSCVNPDLEDDPKKLEQERQDINHRIQLKQKCNEAKGKLEKLKQEQRSSQPSEFRLPEIQFPDLRDWPWWIIPEVIRNTQQQQF